MSDFDLDLRSVEEHIHDDPEETEFDGRIVLGVLDGTTDASEWIETVSGGDVLVLDVDGDLNELAAGFARHVRAEGGSLVHFRGFLVVAPAAIDIDSARLQSKQ